MFIRDRPALVDRWTRVGTPVRRDFFHRLSREFKPGSSRAVERKTGAPERAAATVLSRTKIVSRIRVSRRRPGRFLTGRRRRSVTRESPGGAFLERSESRDVSECTFRPTSRVPRAPPASARAALRRTRATGRGLDAREGNSAEGAAARGGLELGARDARARPAPGPGRTRASSGIPLARAPSEGGNPDARAGRGGGARGAGASGAGAMAAAHRTMLHLNDALASSSGRGANAGASARRYDGVREHGYAPTLHRFHNYARGASGGPGRGAPRPAEASRATRPAARARTARGIARARARASRPRTRADATRARAPRERPTPLPSPKNATPPGHIPSRSHPARARKVNNNRAPGGPARARDVASSRILLSIDEPSADRERHPLPPFPRPSPTPPAVATAARSVGAVGRG